MDLEKSWEKALRHTEILRPRIQPLSTFEETPLSYIFLSEYHGARDTFVRKGKVVVEKPSLLLPPNSPQWEGFDWNAEKKREADLFMNFLLIRGVQFPSFKYNNLTDSLSVYDGRLKQAADHYLALLQKEENMTAGLVLGPEDCWQFSILVFVGSQMLRSADSDLKRLLEEYRKNNKGGGRE
ncbi:MAG TPA: hypothetical protein VL688_00345 [Verrucomicrobiae bacterium]|jgi:hypothetical protein|nr:hypothetical protein [Verrucomicrobiae bacterium]